MKIEKCNYCDCPEITVDGLVVYNDLHYKGCEKLSFPYLRRTTKLTRRQIYQRITEEIERWRISKYKNWIKDFGVVKKVIVEDEVYDTRWDCLCVAG